MCDLQNAHVRGRERSDDASELLAGSELSQSVVVTDVPALAEVRVGAVDADRTEAGTPRTRTKIVVHRPRRPGSPVQFLWDWSGEEEFWFAVHVGSSGGDPILGATVEFGSRASARIGKVWDWWHNRKKANARA